MRRFFLFAAVALATFSAGIGTVSGQPSSPAVHRIALLGDGVGAIRFGQAEPATIRYLDKVLGAQLRTPHGQWECGVDSYLQWKSVGAYFDRQHFVGYSTGNIVSETHWPTSIPDVTTAAGLQIGDTLNRARQIYRAALRTSLEQGGVWFVRTRSGTIGGFLTDETWAKDARIGSIEAGDVGCAAETP